MRIGIIGLGKMGGNIARRLKRAGHDPVTYDANAETGAALGREGMVAADSPADMLAKIGAENRAVWLMLPAGRITEETIGDLRAIMKPGDIIVDGGNTYYKDDIRRGQMLAEDGIRYVDVGTSGGVWGLERGYCMMIGGDDETVAALDPVFGALAPGVGDIDRTPGRNGRDGRVERGYLHAGPCGAGHFVKMVHNGIEYGLMQAYAEGFDILKNKNSPALAADRRYDLNVGDIAEVWRRGSVVSSWLLDLAASALTKDEGLAAFSGWVEDSGEGRWTIEAAIEQSVPADVLSSALYTRFRSRQEHTFAEKLLSAMRMGFGGHVEGKGPSDAQGNPAETHGRADRDKG